MGQDPELRSLANGLRFAEIRKDAIEATPAPVRELRCAVFNLDHPNVFWIDD
jgi:hypothetical protein